MWGVIKAMKLAEGTLQEMFLLQAFLVLRPWWGKRATSLWEGRRRCCHHLCSNTFIRLRPEPLKIDDLVGDASTMHRRGKLVPKIREKRSIPRKMVRSYKKGTTNTSPDLVGTGSFFRPSQGGKKNPVEMRW